MDSILPMTKMRHSEVKWQTGHAACQESPHSCQGHLCSFLAGLPKDCPLHYCCHTLFPKTPFDSSVLLLKMKHNNSHGFQAKWIFPNLGSLYPSFALSSLIYTPPSPTHPKPSRSTGFCLHSLAWLALFSVSTAASCQLS